MGSASLLLRCYFLWHSVYLSYDRKILKYEVIKSLALLPGAGSATSGELFVG